MRWSSFGLPQISEGLFVFVFQGFQIFILFTARTPSFRASVSRSMEYVTTIRIQLKDQTYSLTKNSGTRSGSEVYRDLRHQTTSDTITLQEL